MNHLLRVGSRTAIALALAAALPAAVAAGDIRVMSSGAFTAAYLELAPRYATAANDTVTIAATTIGTGAAAIPVRLERGEAVDVVIMADAVLNDLAARGRIAPGSIVQLARSAIGVVVRTGAPKPDIGSVDAVRRALLGAKSIAYSPSVSGTYFSTELVQRLGIAAQVLPKSRRIDAEPVGAVVARGEAEIGLQQISELLPIAGIDLVGALPQEIQRVTIFSAGVAAGATNPDAARAFIQFLASPEAAHAIARSGMEPRHSVDELRPEYRRLKPIGPTFK